jgi:hypothetical protein
MKHTSNAIVIDPQAETPAREARRQTKKRFAYKNSGENRKPRKTKDFARLDRKAFRNVASTLA